uniref:Uncharacterized protein n=1 Tax=Oryza sativa subsp. japonica TaxID=39947 RepID=Q7XIP4_ORYSJ|nr:hypothetical protein [Oryza sativa Japonica Group]
MMMICAASERTAGQRDSSPCGDGDGGTDTAYANTQHDAAVGNTQRQCTTS